MSGPPSLSYNVGRSRWQAATGALFVGLGVAVMGGMALNPHHFPPAAMVSVAFAVAGSGFAFYRAWRYAPVGTLHWDGAHWHWADRMDYSVQKVQVTMDLQRWMLVWLERETGRPLWLWLEQGGVPKRNWLALRRALVYAARQPRTSNALAQDGAYP